MSDTTVKSNVPPVQTPALTQGVQPNPDARKPYATVNLKKINGRWEIEWSYPQPVTCPVTVRDLRIILRTIQSAYRSHLGGFRKLVIMKQREIRASWEKENLKRAAAKPPLPPLPAPDTGSSVSIEGTVVNESRSFQD